MIKEEVVELSLPFYNGEERTVRVYVPEHEDGETFSVVYMTDGQSLFFDEETRFGSWRIPQTVRAEREKTGRGAVVVGIHNDVSPLQRANELTPKSVGRLCFPPDMPEEARKMVSPEGELFDDFVINTVMPLVEERFPVKKGRENTAFCGSSSGGVQTFFTAMSHPDIFSAAGVFSPCFMLFYPEDLCGWIRSKVNKEPPFLHIYSGGTGGIEEIIRGSIEPVYDTLKELYPEGLLKKVIKPEQEHNESAWEPEFADFLSEFL